MSSRIHRIQNIQRRMRRRAWIPATLGKLESDGSYTLYQSKPDNIVYARIVDETNRLVQAYNLAIKAKPKLDVWLRETEDGYEVVGLRAKRAAEYLGEAAASLNSPDVAGEFLKTIIPALNYEPGHLRLTSTSNLIVHIEPFWYRAQGITQRWPGGTIDLSASLPATSNYWSWCWLGVWPYDNALYAVTGAEVVSRALLTDGTLADLSASMEGLVPCDAVQLQNGMTTITRVEYFQHGRLNAAELGVGGFPTSITSAYYHIPAGRKVAWPETVELDGGTLTIEGTLLIR